MKKLPQWHHTLAWKQIGPYFIIVDPIQNRQILNLNEVGKFIWGYCDGNHTVEQCLHDLVQEYNILQEEAYQDILQFVDSLLKQGVLQSV